AARSASSRSSRGALSGEGTDGCAPRPFVQTVAPAKPARPLWSASQASALAVPPSNLARRAAVLDRGRGSRASGPGGCAGRGRGVLPAAGRGGGVERAAAADAFRGRLPGGDVGGRPRARPGRPEVVRGGPRGDTLRLAALRHRDAAAGPRDQRR